MEVPTSLVLYLNLTKRENVTQKFFPEEMDDSFYTFYPGESFYLFLIVLECAIWIAVIVAEAFLIYVIFKYKKLQTRLNYYILVCAIIKLTEISTIILFEISYHFIEFEFLTDLFYFEYDVSCTIIILYLIFTFGLTLDWFLTNTIPQKIEIYQRYWKKVFAMFLGLGMINIVFEGIICFVEKWRINSFTTYVLMALLFMNFLLVTFINIFKAKFIKNERSNYVLIVSRIIVYSYFVAEIYRQLEYILYNHRFIELLLIYLEIITELIKNCHPILVVYFLGKRNKDFKIAYDQIFRRTIQDYDPEDLNQESVSDILPTIREEEENGSSSKNVLLS